MDILNKKDRVIEILIEQGCTDEQIAQVLAEVSQAGFSQMYSEALLSFSQEDLDKIESCKNQEEANQLIAKTYKERTGREASEVMQKFIDDFCEGFIREYEKEKAKGQIDKS